jgi:RNA polymerase-binding transcription factor DksA
MEDDALRQQLEGEREGLDRGAAIEVEHGQDGVRDDSSAEVAHGVEDSGGAVDGGVERVREPSVLDRVQMELDDVEGALERLDAGSYGTCQTCGGEVGDERLAVAPATRFCGEHQPSTG